MALDVLCVGNTTIDDVVLWDGTTEMQSFGGDAIYAAIAGSWWTDKIEFLAPIGCDYPVENLEVLRSAGWNLIGLPERSVPTLRNWALYEEDGRRRWVMRNDPGDFGLLSPTPEDIPPDYRDSRSFMLLAMDFKAQNVLINALQSQDRGSMVAMDLPEHVLEGNESLILDMVAKVDVFMPSEVEVRHLCGHGDMTRAAREFADLGVKVVVIKLGPEGSLVYDSSAGTTIRAPAYPTSVRDTTGAGDSYCGAFMAMYVQSADARKAAYAGHVSASFTVEDFGLKHMLRLSPTDAQERLRDFERRIESGELSAVAH